MLYPVVLSELMDSDDERPCRGKNREWIKRRSELGIYSTIVKDLIIEDQLGFKSMFRMSLEDFERVLGYIQNMISPKEIIGGTRQILADERLALTLRYLATGESFRSLSFQFRISKPVFCGVGGASFLQKQPVIAPKRDHRVAYHVALSIRLRDHQPPRNRKRSRSDDRRRNARLNARPDHAILAARRKSAHRCHK